MIFSYMLNGKTFLGKLYLTSGCKTNGFLLSSLPSFFQEKTLCTVVLPFFFPCAFLIVPTLFAFVEMGTFTSGINKLFYLFYLLLVDTL